MKQDEKFDDDFEMEPSQAYKNAMVTIAKLRKLTRNL